MATLKELEKEIKDIKKRNKKVEADKAWETSLSRKILIMSLTYFTIVIFLLFTGIPKPFLNAIVPSLGFVLSTLSIPYFKKLWLKFNK